MGQVQDDLCVYKERRFGYKHTKWRDHVIIEGGGMVVYKHRRKVSEKTNPADNLFSDL